MERRPEGLSKIIDRFGRVYSVYRKRTEMLREIRENDEAARLRELNPDGSVKSAAEIAAESKSVVDRYFGNSGNKTLKP